MTNGGDRWAVICGWTLSVLIHVVSLGAAIVITADFSLLPRPRSFQWDVSLVMAPRPVAMMSELPSSSTHGPVSPQRITGSRIARSAVSPPASRLVNHREKLRSILDVDKPWNSQVEKAAAVDMANDHSVFQEFTGPKAEMTGDSEVSGIAAAEQPNDVPTTAVDPADLQVSPLVSEALPPPDVETSDPASMLSEPAFQQQEHLAYRPVPQFHDPVVSRILHADYGWLASALFAKVEQLKRYPHLAKNNRWQGNVVLQAAVTIDGQVGEITVVESSGHPMLDRDAIMLLERASPVALDHPLGQPHVVVQIPIGYRLE